MSLIVGFALMAGLALFLAAVGSIGLSLSLRSWALKCPGLGVKCLALVLALLRSLSACQAAQVASSDSVSRDLEALASVH